MAVEIKVCRNPSVTGCIFTDPNLKWGEDIVEPLLTSDLAAIERGRVEIDREYTNRVYEDFLRGDLTFFQPGKLYSLVDPDQPAPEIGMIRKVVLNFSREEDSFTAQTNIIMELNRE
jgi:hypothetical protein